jgi:hypothetical protein
VIIVFALGLKFAVSNPAEGDGLLRALKICIVHFFGGEVKQSALCCKILRHVKEHFEVRTKIQFPSPVSPALLLIVLLIGLPESSGERIRNFPCRYHFTMVLHAHKSSGDEQ